MIEIEYQPTFATHLLHRCYIFHRDPVASNASYMLLYVNTNGTFKPTQSGDVGVWSIGYLSPPGITELRDYPFARVPQKEIDTTLEHAISRAEVFANNSNSIIAQALLNLVEAYMQIQEDLKNGVPMHRYTT